MTYTFLPVFPVAVNTHHSESVQHQDQTIQLNLGFHLMYLMDLVKRFTTLLALSHFFDEIYEHFVRRWTLMMYEFQTYTNFSRERCIVLR